ncbi:hypothetical protein BGX26_002944 [Mortierella sp. AD094]|nr:hypothetical protein BGX26_002944 [Mortierella sp. AD094]
MRKKREDSCLFGDCKRGLLVKDPTTFDKEERQHFRRYHEQGTRIVVVNGVVFRFRRDPSHQHQYVCVCGSELSNVDSLNSHVQGFQRPSVSRSGCSAIADKAQELKISGKPVHEDKDSDIPFNAWPLDVGEAPAVNIEEAHEAQEAQEAQDAQGAQEAREAQVDNGDDMVRFYDEQDKTLQEAMEKLSRLRAELQKRRQEHLDK